LRNPKKDRTSGEFRAQPWTTRKQRSIASPESVRSDHIPWILIISIPYIWPGEGQIPIILSLDFSLLPGDASGMETPDKRPWWSYLRLSLRGMIVLVSVVGGALGVIAHVTRSASIQREAVAAVRTLPN